jgi:hypothetical protein
MTTTHPCRKLYEQYKYDCRVSECTRIEDERQLLEEEFAEIDTIKDSEKALKLLNTFESKLRKRYKYANRCLYKRKKFMESCDVKPNERHANAAKYVKKECITFYINLLTKVMTVKSNRLLEIKIKALKEEAEADESVIENELKDDDDDDFYAESENIEKNAVMSREETIDYVIEELENDRLSGEIVEVKVFITDVFEDMQDALHEIQSLGLDVYIALIHIMVKNTKIGVLYCAFSGKNIMEIQMGNEDDPWIQGICEFAEHINDTKLSDGSCAYKVENWLLFPPGVKRRGMNERAGEKYIYSKMKKSGGYQDGIYSQKDEGGIYNLFVWLVEKGVSKKKK